MKKMSRGKGFDKFFVVTTMVVVTLLLSSYLYSSLTLNFSQITLENERDTIDDFLTFRPNNNLESEFNYSKINSWGERNGKPAHWYDIVIQDDIAFILRFNLLIYNISDPESPILISKYISPWGRIIKIFVEDNFGYIICQFQGVVILDFSNLSEPEELGKCGSFSENEYDDEIIIDGYYSDGFVYLLTYGQDMFFMAHTYFNNLYVIDVSDSENIYPIGFYTDKYIVAIFAYNNYCYLLISKDRYEYRITILNVNRRNNLKIIAKIDVESFYYLYFYPDDTYSGSYSNSAGYFQIINDYLFIKNRYNQTTVIDISQISKPKIIAKINITDWSNLYIQNNYLYCLTTHYNLEIFNIIDLNNPVLQKEISLEKNSIQLAMTENNLYIIGDYLSIYNLIDPIDPILITKINLQNKYNYNQIIVRNNLVYLINGSRFIDILTISNPLNIDIINQLDLSYISTLNETEEYIRVFYYKEDIFVFSFGTYIMFINCSNTNNPQHICSINTSISIKELSLSNNSMYVVSADRLIIYDINNISNPLLLINRQVIGEIQGIRINSNVALIFSRYRDGFEYKAYFLFYDVINNIEIFSEIQFNDFLISACIEDSILYYTTSNELMIINLTNPTEMRNISLIDNSPYISFSVLSIYTYNSILFILTFNELLMFDITDLCTPKLIGKYSEEIYNHEFHFRYSPRFTDFHLKNNYIYLIHSIYGFIIVGSDRDNDHLADYLENNKYDTSDFNSDSDFDGVLDGYEIYTGLDPLNSSDGSLDQDEDGLNNINEGYYQTNPFSNDTDKDGFLDKEEIDLGTLQNYFDTDHDGLSDGVEVKIFRTDPFKSNTDGDNYDDFQEIAMGRNPKIWDRWKLLFGGIMLPFYCFISCSLPNIIRKIKGKYRASKKQDKKTEYYQPES
jgi:hypothetical protein